MSEATTQDINTLSTAAVPSAPPEAHQRADVGAGEPEYRGLSATYSPEDNKLRLYSVSRLGADLYARVRGAGFAWAPKQEFFVAPMWTPGREDLLIELCGEIGDEDTTLAQRAEERADRFEDYSEKRGADASAARDAAASISSRFEFGQPILVGHHSERKARKDKERIDNSMRKAVQMWDTANYWQARAKGAKRHAEYKQLPAVRHRRLKGLGADLRKQEKALKEHETFLAMWQVQGLTVEQAVKISNFDYLTIQREGKPYPESLYSLLTAGDITTAEAVALAVKKHNSGAAWCRRWIAHYTNRMDYEKAMLDESGGIKADAFDIQAGGRVLVDGEWLTVTRVNKAGGVINSVSTNARYVKVKGIEEVKGYEAPSAEDADRVKAATTLPPLCNYPGEGFHSMTKAEWDATHKDYKGSRELGQGAARSRAGSGRPDIKPGEGVELVGRHRVRSVVHRGALVAVFISDAKRKDAPAPVAAPAEPVQLPIVRDVAEAEAARPVQQLAQRTEFDAMRETLRAGGVQTVTAPQLFPTPATLAERMAQEAGMKAGCSVLEPSAGTGSLLRAVAEQLAPATAQVVAVEINPSLVVAINKAFPDVSTICGDFLRCDPRDLGFFDVVLMNPPFVLAQDIEHIQHAKKFVRPGGRLVAICANGPRQQAALKPLAEASGGFYEPLPPGTFKESGTGVNTALLVIEG